MWPARQHVEGLCVYRQHRLRGCSNISMETHWQDESRDTRTFEKGMSFLFLFLWASPQEKAKGGAACSRRWSRTLSQNAPLPLTP